MKIFIVEDDELYALQLEAMLLAKGYDVLGKATTYQNAIDFLQNKSVDIAIVDIELNETEDGFLLAEYLQTKGIPYILITAYDSPQFYEKANKLNSFAYLVKPFHIYSLESVIRLLLKNQIANQFIKLTTRGQAIPLNDIIFIQVKRTYIYVQTTSRKFVVKKSLTVIKKDLPATEFLQIQRSYIAQKKYIKNINFEKDRVEMEGGYYLPLSPKLKQQIQTSQVLI